MSAASPRAHLSARNLPLPLRFDGSGVKTHGPPFRKLPSALALLAAMKNPLASHRATRQANAFRSRSVYGIV